MTIELTDDEVNKQFQEAAEEQLQWDPSDQLDTIYKFDACISQGWRREICLRKGIALCLDQHNLKDQWLLNTPDKKTDTIMMCFKLSGQEEDVSDARSSKSVFFSKARRYTIESNGLLDKETTKYSGMEQYHRFYVYTRPEIIRSFTGTSDGELPKDLQHLIRPSSNEAAYERNSDIQPQMNTVIQQILQCPYQGMVKRAYLESKTIELIALVLEHEIAIQQGEFKPEVLKPEQLERIYYAKEILLKDLSNPPSLLELASQVGLNGTLLKSGFRSVFGTTVFGALQSHRLAIAKQLLAEQDTSVAEVAHLVGYTSPRAFARAFGRKFQMGPKAYQKTCR